MFKNVFLNSTRFIPLKKVVINIYLFRFAFLSHNPRFTAVLSKTSHNNLLFMTLLSEISRSQNLRFMTVLSNTFGSHNNLRFMKMCLEISVNHNPPFMILLSKTFGKHNNIHFMPIISENDAGFQNFSNK